MCENPRDEYSAKQRRSSGKAGGYAAVEFDDVVLNVVTRAAPNRPSFVATRELLRWQTRTERAGRGRAGSAHVANGTTAGTFDSRH